MPDMSVLDDILVEMAETALPSTRRHGSLDRLKKVSLADTPVSRTRPSLPKLRYWQESDLIQQQQQHSSSSSSSSPPPLQCRQESLVLRPPASPVAVSEHNGTFIKHQLPSVGDITEPDSRPDISVFCSGNSCTFPRRSARLSGISPLNQVDVSLANSQVPFRQNGDNISSSLEKKEAEQQHLRCPFDTFLNLEFVEFCNNLASIRLPESVRQSFRKAATQRKKKWRKSMDQMLYSEEVLSTLHQPDTLHDQEKSQEGPALLSAASTVKSSDNGINGDSIQEDSHELNEAVRTFEQTLQRHLSNTYKDPVGALRIVEEDEEEFNLSYTDTYHKTLSNGHSLSPSCHTVQYFNTAEIADDAQSRESLFTVPRKRAPKSASSLTSSFPEQAKEKDTSSSSSPGSSFQATKSVSCTSISNTVTISAHVLESIREKLATSLEQMNQLQARVQRIPQLEAEILQLQEELRSQDAGRITISMSDAGIMTSLVESPVMKRHSATNTLPQETVESTTCQNPPPLPAVQTIVEYYSHKSERGADTARKRRNFLKKRAISIPIQVKRRKRRESVGKTSISNSGMEKAGVTEDPDVLILLSDAEFEASETLSESLSESFELVISSENPEAELQNHGEDLFEENMKLQAAPSPKEEGPLIKENGASSPTSFSNQSFSAVTIETCLPLSPPIDEDDDNLSKLWEKETSVLDQSVNLRKESDTSSFLSFLPSINEESTEEIINADDKAVVAVQTNTVSTSGVSEDSNASMSSSNSEELDMMASLVTSESSDHEDEGSYDLLHGQLSNKCFEEIPEVHSESTVSQEKYPCPRTVSKELLAACKVLKDSMHRGREGRGSTRIESSIGVIQQEWFSVAGSKNANAEDVNTYLDTFESLSKKLLNVIVNLLDNNGNTVLHYALSHNNFSVVSVILDSKVCNVDMVNQAGYTPVMLASLAALNSHTDRTIADRLFGMGDINRRAQQHGQTALMLAVSHGRADTVKMLLQVGADLNIQDNDGSTALMCASEHGHIEIVKLLLAHSDIDVHLTDQDGMCALYVALEAGHKDIAALVYGKTTLSDTTNHYAVASKIPLHSSNRKMRASSASNGNPTATL